MPNRIPTIAGVLVLLVGLVAGVYLVQSRQIFKLSASPEAVPKNVRVTNITDTTLSVSWTTNKLTGGFVKWGVDNEVDRVVNDEISVPSFTHAVTLEDLTPSTEYFFVISSDGTEFDNNGIYWSAKTGEEISSKPGTNIEPISGLVLTQESQPAKYALVYVNLAGSAPMSTLTSEEGRWILPISETRSQDLSSLLEIDEDKTLVEVSVQAGPLGIASAQTYPSKSRPVPTIVLGSVHDFKNVGTEGSEEMPDSSINMPNVTPTGTAKKEVVLESIDEGEVILTNNPEFFGEGPPGATITIKIESDPVTEQVKVDSSGNWKWTPPEDLTEGVHTVTLSWRDINGILQTITKTFVVNAQEGPAFESTPSRTPSPTPRLSPTATPRLTPSPRATVSPSPSPRVTPAPQPTSTPLPDAGVTTPTLIFLALGFIMVLLSLSLFYLPIREAETK